MSKPSDTDRYHFRHSFERLPPVEQDEVLRLLREATLWRGHRGLGNLSMVQRVEEIAEVFSRNGMELPEYT